MQCFVAPHPSQSGVFCRGYCSAGKSSFCHCIAPELRQVGHVVTTVSLSLQSPIQLRVGNGLNLIQAVIPSAAEFCVSHIEAGSSDEAAIAATGFSTALCEIHRSRGEGDECRRDDDKEVRREKRGRFLFFLWGGQQRITIGFLAVIDVFDRSQLRHWAWLRCHCLCLVSYRKVSIRLDIRVVDSGAWRPSEFAGLASRVEVEGLHVAKL